MSYKTEALAPAQSSRELNLVCGSGGSRAILGSSGAILACHVAGIDNWRTLGGASGGSIPTALLAGGVHPTKIVRLTIEIDFSSLLSRHASLLRIILASLLQGRFERTRPRKGVLSSEKLGQFVESQVQSWPKGYWTVAVSGDKQWLFNAEGIFEYSPDGSCRQLSTRPAPLGLAVRASCAVPGVIDAVPYNGTYLFDGALSIDGRCPVGAAKRHFKTKPEAIVACDVGEDESKGARRRRMILKLLHLDEWQAAPATPVDFSGTVVIKPTVTNFRSLQFTLSLDQKWQAVMSGFMGAVPALENAGLLTAERLDKAKSMVAAFQEIQRSAVAEGELAARTVELIKLHELY